MIGEVEYDEAELEYIRSGKKRWGRWSFLPGPDPSVGVRMSDDPQDELYDFELDRCDDELKIGNWILHLSYKEWIIPRDISDFVDMLTDLYEAKVFVLKVYGPAQSCCAAYGCINDSTDGDKFCEEHGGL